MHTRSRVIVFISLMVIAAYVLGACSPQTVEVVRTVEVERPVVQTVEVTQQVIQTVEVVATPEPVDRNGGWLDLIVAVEEPSSESAVSRIAAGELDVFAFTVSDPDLLRAVQEDPNQEYIQAYGASFELTFNVVGPVFESTDKLNPFAVPAIRSAMNLLVDRNHIAEEIMSGLGKPRFFPLTTIFPDYNQYIEVARRLEGEYAYNPERAREIITAEMEALGAELIDGKWMYEGEPVELIFLIRVEDERREIGDYVANQLESIGFTVLRDFKTSAEAAPIWNRGDPADGQWHLYTGGWINTRVLRDQGVNFSFYYTPSGLPLPLWQAYTPSPEFLEVADRLAVNDFSSLDERAELFAQAMEFSLAESMRIFLVDQIFFSPFRSDLSITSDLAAGIHGSQIWPYSLRREGEVGGAVTFSTTSIMTEPWNPIGGTNWVYDQALITASEELAIMPDPFTGLFWPQRIERADVTVREGLPVQKSLDWVSLDFAPEIQVPADAWIDWDATEQRFIQVSEQNPDGLTANTKTVFYFPEQLKDLKWHDGSNFDLADILMYMIMVFDPAKPESAIYDEAYVPFFEAVFKAPFKGVRIVQEEPLVIEYYSDQFFLDAEEIAFTNSGFLFPTSAFGPGAWHNLAVGVLAEANEELAFSGDKADALEVEWMSYIGGPSLEILAKYLEQAASESYIPYEPTLGQYINGEEAQTRWSNLQAWYRDQGHFWLGTGPYYVDRAFPVEGTILLKHNPYYPDAANRWDLFTVPRIAEVELDGPGRVEGGSEATFDVFIDFDGEPYPQADISEVKYLVYDSAGDLVLSGEASAVEDGHYQVTLDSDQLSQLGSGSNLLEVVVSPSVVSFATNATYGFVTVGQ